jgi:hypothetical protein
LSGNTRKKNDPTRAGVMISGWGNYGKTASVCSAGAVFEKQWLELHGHLNPQALPGTRDLHAPVVYVSTPVTATPKSLCTSLLASPFHLGMAGCGGKRESAFLTWNDEPC